MVMKLDKRSEEDLNYCRPGVGVIFIKVAENNIRMIEFAPAINNTLRTLPLPSLLNSETSKDLHDWIEERSQEYKKNKKGISEE